MKKLSITIKLIAILSLSSVLLFGDTRAVPGDVVITEVFTRSNGNIPDYIELFNMSTNIQNLQNWSITVYNTDFVLEVPDGIDDPWSDVYSLSPNSFMFITGFDGYFSGEDSTVYKVKGDLRLIEDNPEYNADFHNFVTNAPRTEEISNGVWARFTLSHIQSEIELKDGNGTVIDRIFYENDDYIEDGIWDEEFEFPIGTYQNADFISHAMELKNEVLSNFDILNQTESDWISSVHSTPFMFTSPSLYDMEEFYMEFGSPGYRNLLNSKISLFNMQCGPMNESNLFCSEIGAECSVGSNDQIDFNTYIDIPENTCVDEYGGTWHEFTEPEPLITNPGICYYTCEWSTTPLLVGETEELNDPHQFDIFHDQIPGGSKTLKFSADSSSGIATIEDHLWMKNGTVIQLGESIESSFSQGIHELVLLVKDSQGLWAVDSFNFEIIEPNYSPLSIIEATQEVIEMPHNGDPTPSITPISIFGNQSCDCDDYIYKRWTVDHIVETEYNCNQESCSEEFYSEISDEISELDIFYWSQDGNNISTNPDLYSFVDQLGEFSYTLIVNDNYGASGDASITLLVEPEPNLPPVADIQGNPYVEFQEHDGIPYNTETLYMTVDFPSSLPAIYNFSEDQMLDEDQQSNDDIYSLWYFVDGSDCIPQTDYCIENNLTCYGCSEVELPIGTYTFVLEVFDSYNCSFNDPDTNYCGYYDSGPEYFTDENNNGIYDLGEDFTDFNGNDSWDEDTPYSSDTDTITIIFSEPNDPPTVFAAPQDGLTFIESATSTIYAEVFDPEFFENSDQQDGFCYPNYESVPECQPTQLEIDNGTFSNSYEKCCLKVEWDLLWKCDGSCDSSYINNMFEGGNADWMSGLTPNGAECAGDQCDEAWLLNPDEVILNITAQENPNFEPDTLYIELRATDPFYNAGYASDDFISRDTAIVYIINENQPPVYGPTDEFEWLLPFPENGFDIWEDTPGIYVNGEQESDSTINLMKYFIDPDNEELEFGFLIQSNEWLVEIYDHCVDQDGTIYNYPDECPPGNIMVLSDSIFVIRNILDRNGDARVTIFASDSETTINTDFWVHIYPTNDTPIADDGLVTLLEFHDFGANDPAWFNLTADPGGQEAEANQELEFVITESTQHGIYEFDEDDNQILEPWDGYYSPYSEFFGFDTLKFIAYDNPNSNNSDTSEVANYVFQVEKSNNTQPVIRLVTMDVYEDEILELNVNSNDDFQAEDFTDDNENGQYDYGEEFIDCGYADDGNHYCEGHPLWLPEYGNGIWDPAHPLAGYRYVGLDVLDDDNDCTYSLSPSDCNDPEYSLDNLLISIYDGAGEHWYTIEDEIAQGFNYIHLEDHFSDGVINVQVHVDDQEYDIPGPTESNPQVIALNVIPVNDKPFAYDTTHNILEDDIFTFVLDGLDVEDDDLRFMILDTIINDAILPHHGQLITENIPEIQFVPEADYNGLDSFYYYIGDNGFTEGIPDSLYSSPIKVIFDIAQVNDPPRVDTTYFVEDSVTQVFEDSENIHFYLLWTDIDMDPYLNEEPSNFEEIDWSFNTTNTEDGLKFWVNEENYIPHVTDCTFTDPVRYLGRFTIDSLLEHWNGTDSSIINISDSNPEGNFPYQYKLTVTEVNDPPTIDTVRIDTSLLTYGIDYIIEGVDYPVHDEGIPISIAEDSHDIPLFIYFDDVDTDPFLNVDPKPMLDYSWEFEALNNRFTILNEAVFDTILNDSVDFFWIDTIQSDWNGIEYLKTTVTDSDGDSNTVTIPFHVFQVNDIPEPFEYYPLLYQYPLYPDTNAFYLNNYNNSWTFRLPESDDPLTQENPVQLLVKWQRTQDKDLDTLLSQDSTSSRINNLYYRLELTTEDTTDYNIVLKSRYQDSKFNVDEDGNADFTCESDLNISSELCEFYGLVDSLAFLKLDLTDKFFGYRKLYFDNVNQIIDTIRNAQVDLSGNTLYNLEVIAYNSERTEESDTSAVDLLAGYDVYGFDLSRLGNPNQSQSIEFRADLQLPEFQFNIIRNDIFWEFYDLYITQSEPILEELSEESSYTPILELVYESGGRDTISRTSSEHGPIYYTNTFKDTGDITFKYSARDLVENYGISEKTIHYKIVDPLSRTVVVTPSDESSIIISPGDVSEMTSIIAMDHYGELITNKSSSEFFIGAEFIPEYLELNNSVELRFYLGNSTDDNLDYWNYILMKKTGHEWIELDNLFSLNNNILKTEIDQLGIYSIISNPELEQPLPDHFKLHPNYPNPFNGSTVIKFEIPEDAHIKIQIVDILGTVVDELENNTMSAGYHSVTWDGTNANGIKTASGVYFINLKIDKSENHVQKLMYLK